MHLVRHALAIGLVAVLLTGCKPAVKDTTSATSTANDSALSALDKELDQNWTPTDRKEWYQASQGSRLLPLTWLLALEGADGKPLLSDDNVRRWGYLPYVNNAGHALPVGFAEDSATPPAQLTETALTWRKTPLKSDATWVGMNCAACHTAEITYKGKTLRVDGGPALSNFELLLADMRAALTATQADPARFDRFATQVLGPKPLIGKSKDDTPENRDLLAKALGKLIAREQELARLNATATATEAGYGRLDAFGHIFNKVAYVAKAPNQVANPSDAPVSYPFLWNVPQHDKIQWNGIAPKKDIPGSQQPYDVGALGRNAGEVIGVFADIQPVPGTLKGYRSSMNVENLVALEQKLSKLKSPAWPVSVFGWGRYEDPVTKAVSEHDALVTDGKTLYAQRCVACHALLPDRTDPAFLTTPIKAQMALFRPANPLAPNTHESAGTDPWMACNAYTRVAYTGVLKGTPKTYVPLVPGSDPMGDMANLSDMLRVTVGGALVEKKGQVIATATESFFGVKRPPTLPTAAAVRPGVDPRLQRCLTTKADILGYKGRPLNGVWATAPFLHNGSVRSLYQLLLPEADREAAFEVGNREFDPVDVGYVSSATGNHSTFQAADPAGPVHGNSNRGHDYGNATLSKRDRYAIIEFMKTL